MKKQPYLGSPVHTAAVLRSHGITARKKYGQNFLVDADVLEETVRAAGLTETDGVLEIGPGIGTLTQYLAFSAGKVVAVEIDRTLLPVLEDTLMGWNNVEVVNGDILKMDLEALVRDRYEGRPVKVVANLPYYITTPIIMKLFESGAPIESVTCMVQKEVADRMQAQPGSKEYGALSLSVQYFARPEVVRIVHPSSFMPQPGVDSAVVHLKRYPKPPVSVTNETLLFEVIRASFNQRRKKLTNGIAGFGPFLKKTDGKGYVFTKEDAARALTAAGLSPDVRGEKLSLEEFARLTDSLLSR